MLIPELLFSLFIYLSLIKLFGLYRKEDIFTFNHINQLRSIGIFLLMWPVFSLLYPILLMLLRISGLAESLPFILSIGSDHFIKPLIGLIIFVMC